MLEIEVVNRVLFASSFDIYDLPWLQLHLVGATNMKPFQKLWGKEFAIRIEPFVRIRRQRGGLEPSQVRSDCGVVNFQAISQKNIAWLKFELKGSVYTLLGNVVSLCT